MKKILSLIFLVIFLSSTSAFSMSEEERVDDAKYIINLFTQQYAPLPWKEEYLGLDFDTISKNFLNNAANAASDIEFYDAVVKFLDKFQDTHISYRIPSSYRSFLYLDFEYFDGKVLIVDIDRKKLSEEVFPFDIGDELISFDGQSAVEAIKSLLPYNSYGYLPTSMKLASWDLTYRPQYRYPYAPIGSVTMSVLRQGESVPQEVALEWITKGFNLTEMAPKSSVKYMAETILPAKTLSLGGADFEHDRQLSVNSRKTGTNSPTPFFPLWEGFEPRLESPYFTGIFSIGNKKIGFIRVRTWMVDGYQRLLPILEKEIAYMNNNTDALIIDQTSNTGGYGGYAAGAVSYFITEPIDHMKMQLRANRGWLSDYELWADEMSEDLLPHFEIWREIIRDSVEKGEYLTPPVSTYFPEFIYPNRDKNNNLLIYTKPVLVLVNELAFSAGDKFPSMMQDWGLAKIFGTRTTGAGGSVTYPKLKKIGNSEMEIALTINIMYRHKEVMTDTGIPTHYIENVGVTPDIEYTITAEDFLNEYKDYRNAIDSAVIDLIEGNN